MESVGDLKQIIVAPQVFVSLAQESQKTESAGKGPCHADIAMAWSWDEANFRMDISLPLAGALDIIFPLKADIVYVNGEIVWDSRGSHKTGSGTTTVQPAGGGLRLNFAAGGPYHILARGLSEREPR